MLELLQQLNLILASAGLLLLAVIAIIGLDFYSGKALKRLVKAWGMLVALLTASGSVVMTLIYSEGFGIVPCGLCWFQRVFLYPQVFLLSMSLFYKEKIAARYGLLLSIPGLVVALYQHYLQMGGSQFVACPTSGADCSKRFLFEYGFVTFPLLSAILFLFLIVLYIYIIKIDSEDKK